MHCAALITYSLPLAVYSDRVQLDQYGTAFRAYPDYSIAAITAEHVLTSVFRMLPSGNIFCIIADMA
jgi:hypothetical protein